MGNRVSNVGEVRKIIAGEVFVENEKKSNRMITSKYSIITFLPKNILEQFRRIANIYFLVVSILAVVIDSPVSPVTSLAPLVFVIAVTMVKQGYEDWIRHKVDYVVNNEHVSVLRKSILQEIKCHEVRIGDLVRIGRDCDVPCDAVLLWSSDSRGKCFVTTANLDGETSLKPLKVPASLVGTTPEKYSHSRIAIECLDPVADIYTFHGKITVGDVTSPITTENLLLRGSRLKNTEWAIGCTVYVGKETKISLNSRFASNKFTSCEAYINNFLTFFITILVAEIIISFALKRYLESIRTEHDQYLGPNNSSYSFISIFQDILSFLLLYYYCVPISLYVTIELHKFIGSLYLQWDVDLQCPETLQSTIANNSDLNEELGQVEILFSDKTGTLTKNDMYFQMCSVYGELYIEKNGRLYEMNSDWIAGETVQSIGTLKADLSFFFTVLALCHTVQVEESFFDEINLNGGIVMNNNVDDPKIKIPDYQAMSSDEIAFVRAAANRGIVFYGDESNVLILRHNDGKVQKFEKLHLIEFTSSRRRMSIIVKDESGKIWLFCKGAESAVLPLCHDSPLIQSTNDHVQYFAKQGLRTLALAYKELTLEQYTAINEDLCQVNLDIRERSSHTPESADRWKSMEEGLTLLGATGVEDRLQDCVADTLQALREAGIKIWVLTGDKVETALNVAQSCGHITEKSQKMFLTEILTPESVDEQMDTCRLIVEDGAKGHLTLVVDGQSVAFILGTKREELFVKISMSCESVICCRLSPLQKAQIVRLIKKSPTRPVTAAIGDGANDISMIQAAHVGFGIFGREGRQAARSADFAFTKFMMLKKMLLVHGHWYYQRLATLVQYFFYKNLIFVNLMIFFQIDSGFSTQSIFDSMFLTFYNLAFTAAPILALSLTEQCHTMNELMTDSSLYEKQTRNKLLSWKNFISWSIMAILHSVILYYSFYAVFAMSSSIFWDGTSSGLWCFGACLFSCLVIIVNLKIWIHARYQSYIFIYTVVASIMLCFIMTTIYSIVELMHDGDVLGTFSRLLQSATYWLSIIFVVTFSLLPDYCYKIYKSIMRTRRKRLMDFVEMRETRL